MRRFSFISIVALALVAVVPASAQESAPEGGDAAAETAIEDDESRPAEQPAAGDVADWSALEEWLGSLELSEKRVLVVSPQPDFRTDIEEVVSETLESGGTALVLDDSPLSLTSDSSDEEIVSKAKNLPVDTILVVRLFGKPASLVISGYTAGGEAVATEAFPADRLPPAPKPSAPARMEIADGGAMAAESTSNETAEAAEGGAESPEAEEAGPDLEVATAADIERYDSEKWQLVAFDGSTLVVRHGAEDRTVKGDEALAILEKPELVEAWRSTMKLKRGLYWTAGGLAAAGLATMLVGFFTLPSAYDGGDDIPGLNVGLFIGGFGGIFTGIITAVVGWNIDAIDATRKEVRGWVREKNEPLRDELGIPEHLSLQIAPLEGGGSALVTFRF